MEDKQKTPVGVYRFLCCIGDCYVFTLVVVIENNFDRGSYLTDRSKFWDQSAGKDLYNVKL